METISKNYLNLRAIEKHIMYKLTIFFFFFISTVSLANEGSGEIYTNLEKLHSLKRVLYVAAHPDDENTRALAWFSLGEKAETAYFSLTRGDGGQNLIGDELSAQLGVLRTQELLAARSYDGAKQFFSRAVDFGYSKSADESFEKWGKEGLMEDLVLMIRKFKPDVIITRFPPDERAGHGHHTASALLAMEAFRKAADAAYLPQQVKEWGTWQATSVYWNTSYWWDENIKDMAEGDPNYIIKDIGGYNASLGMSYNEIGTIARSQHKCQGFGAVIERGSRLEYFKHLEGKKLKSDFFENNTQQWSTLIGKELDKKFQQLLDAFDFKVTANNVPVLLELLKGFENLPSSMFRDEKIARCQQIIRDCLGLYADLHMDDYSFVNGATAHLKLELINRSSKNITLLGARLNEEEKAALNEVLASNEVVTKDLLFSGKVENTSPFWLKAPFSTVFKIENPADFGAAENRPVIEAEVFISIDGAPFSFKIPAIYKWRDPAYGERMRPILATPRFTANFDQDIALMKASDQKSIRIKIHSFQDSLVDTLRWKNVNSWSFNEKEVPIFIAKKHGEMWITLDVKMKGTKGRKETLTLTDANGAALFQYTEIAYDHIPTQAILSPAELACIPIDAQIKKGKVAYINGVQDAVPNAILDLGFDLDVLEVADLNTVDLSQYQSIVLGIRIYNVHPELRNYETQLYAYVENGGNLIMQYNTASRSASDEPFGPKPFHLSRERVTEEDAKVTFLNDAHPILNQPNKITPSDFENWVQERGLYFAGDWDEAYTPLLSWSDRGEEPVQGGLIVLQHGKGQFVYTGISFFRELPNGVTGAYRLFANLLSY